MPSQQLNVFAFEGLLAPMAAALNEVNTTQAIDAANVVLSGAVDRDVKEFLDALILRVGKLEGELAKATKNSRGWKVIFRAVTDPNVVATPLDWVGMQAQNVNVPVLQSSLRDAWDPNYCSPLMLKTIPKQHEYKAAAFITPELSDELSEILTRLQGPQTIAIDVYRRICQYVGSVTKSHSVSFSIPANSLKKFNVRSPEFDERVSYLNNTYKRSVKMWFQGFERHIKSNQLNAPQLALHMAPYESLRYATVEKWAGDAEDGLLMLVCASFAVRDVNKAEGTVGFHQVRSKEDEDDRGRAGWEFVNGAIRWAGLARRCYKAVRTAFSYYVY